MLDLSWHRQVVISMNDCVRERFSYRKFGEVLQLDQLAVGEAQRGTIETSVDEFERVLERSHEWRLEALDAFRLAAGCCSKLVDDVNLRAARIAEHQLSATSHLTIVADDSQSSQEIGVGETSQLTTLVAESRETPARNFDGAR